MRAVNVFLKCDWSCISKISIEVPYLKSKDINLGDKRWIVFIWVRVLQIYDNSNILNFLITIIPFLDRCIAPLTSSETSNTSFTWGYRLLSISPAGFSIFLADCDSKLANI